MEKETPYRACQECGKLYRLSRQDKRYCSPACRWKAWDRAHPRQKLDEKREEK